MKRLFWLAAGALVVSACLTRRVDEPLAARTSEPARGLEPLFDGRSLAGWRGYRQSGVPSGWQVVDGALTRVGEGGDLVTVEEFGDFVLDFEWRVAPGANSGVMFRVDEELDAPWRSGPEYQILDNAGHPDGREPRTSAAANYAMHAPLADVTRPVGAWNQARLLVRGDHVEHWLNGQRVLEYELGSEDWRARVAACKWKDHPDYGKRPRGRIVLQDHGDWVAYRELRLQRLGEMP